MVHQRVTRYGVYPLPKGVVTRVLVEVQIYLYEGLLQQVARHISVSHPLLEEACQRITIACKEILKGLLVTRRGEFHEVGICGYDIIVYFHNLGVL